MVVFKIIIQHCLKISKNIAILLLFFTLSAHTIFGVYNEDASTPGTNVLQVNNMKITVIRGKVIFAHLLLSMNIQVQTDEIYKKLQHNAPIIVDAFFTDLYGAMGDLWIPNRDPKPETIQRRLQRILDTVMQPGEAKVYVGTFYLQRLQ